MDKSQTTADNVVPMPTEEEPAKGIFVYVKDLGDGKRQVAYDVQEMDPLAAPALLQMAANLAKTNLGIQ